MTTQTDLLVIAWRKHEGNPVVSTLLTSISESQTQARQMLSAVETSAKTLHRGAALEAGYAVSPTVLTSCR